MLLLLFLIALPALAQVTTGAISGYILDPSQHAIADAEVVARDNAHGFERRVRADRSGFYAVGELAPAVYQVSASASGFEPSAAYVATSSVKETVRSMAWTLTG